MTSAHPTPGPPPLQGHGAPGAVPDPGGDLRTARPEGRTGGQHPLAGARRPHVAARMEDALDRRLAALLRSRGWTVRIEPYPGYGSPGWARVMARALLAAPVVPDADLPGTGAVQAGAGAGAVPVARQHPVRGWRSYFTVPVAGAVVEVVVGDRVHRVTTDRAGYVDQVVASDLPVGWHEVALRTQDGATAVAPVQVVDPAARVGLVSDIDDTVMVTHLPRPLVAAWNVLVRDENAREPVPGMAALYRRLVEAEPGAPVVYLSTGAWNAAPAVGRFLHRHGFPPGTLLMTDWGPTNTGWFRSGPAHKVAQLRRLFAEFPDVRWVLVGDDGQRDPEVYSGAARRLPEHVRALALRELSPTEHLLASGEPTPLPGGQVAQRDARRQGIAVLHGPDGRVLAERFESVGLLPDPHGVPPWAHVERRGTAP